jgi:hypothetical protein
MGELSPQRAGKIDIPPPGTAAATTLVGAGLAEYDRGD